MWVGACCITGKVVRVDSTSTGTWASVSTPYVTPRQAGQPEAWAQEAAAYGRRGTQRLREVGVIEAPGDVAEALGLAPGESVVARRRVIMLDERPVELADSFYPVAIATGTRLAEPGKIPGGAPTLLAELGYRAHRVREDVSARVTTQAEQALLRLAEPGVVLVLFRVSGSEAAVPFEVSVLTMLADQRQLRYQLVV